MNLFLFAVWVTDPWVTWINFWGPFLESSGNFSGPESHSKISNLTITELFYSHILNMNRGSLHTRSFRCLHFLRYRWTNELKMVLRAWKVSGAFEKRAPGPVPNEKPVMGSWPNQWNRRFQEVSQFLETHTFARNILHSCLNARKSEGLSVAFDTCIFVSMYERYDRNCVCLRHKFHRIEERTRRPASSFRRVSNLSGSLRFFFDKCVVSLVIDTTLTFRGNRLTSHWLTTA